MSLMFNFGNVCDMTRSKWYQGDNKYFCPFTIPIEDGAGEQHLNNRIFVPAPPAPRPSQLGRHKGTSKITCSLIRHSAIVGAGPPAEPKVDLNSFLYPPPNNILDVK